MDVLGPGVFEELHLYQIVFKQIQHNIISRVVLCDLADGYGAETLVHGRHKAQLVARYYYYFLRLPVFEKNSQVLDWLL